MVGGDAFRKQELFGGLRVTRGGRHHVCDAEAGRARERHGRNAEEGLRARVDEVAVKEHRERFADGRTRHQGDDGLRKAAQHRKEVAHFPIDAIRGFEALLKVGTRREHGSFAFDQNDANAGVRFGAPKRLGERGEHVGGDRVAAFGAADRQTENAEFELGNNGHDFANS